jgi:hypothetical protein
MKITTVREIVQKDGSKTIITIEDELNGDDPNQLDSRLSKIGFYDSQSTLQRFMRFLTGKW